MQNNHNFIIGPTDTDSISFCKEDGTSFSAEERSKLVKELNDISPEFMIWEDDGFYEKVIVLKAKNYVLYDGKKITIKGSALKATTKAPALKEFVREMIQTIIDEKYDYVNIYNRYVQEILNIRSPDDIRRWAAKKTVTDKIYESERTNETKVKDAIGDTDVQEGDKIYVYYRSDDTLSLVEHFDGDYNPTRLLKNLFDTAKIYDTIIPKETFTNYSLKKNKKVLDEQMADNRRD